MRRRWMATMLGATAAVLMTPGAAQARTACPSETASPTSANAAQVSDAIVCLTNQIRAGYGLPVMRRDARLDAAARSHSEDMAARGFFDHENPDMKGPGDRATAQGYTIGVGENIAKGQKNARAVMTTWMKSEGHCHNILSAARDIGVGTATSGSPIYTQDFGDYYAVAVNQAPANSCPYTLDLSANVTEPPGSVGSSGLVLSALKLSPRHFRAGHKTTISYKLTGAAAVRLRIERGKPGRRVGGSCVARKPSNRLAKRCTRYVKLVGKIDHAGRPGTNTLSFFGRLKGKRLKHGSYRLRAVATSASGSSPLKRAAFKITKP